ncbi:Lysine exporter protein [Actinobacillus pleuropneumoniae]|nr:Lysine exporter protein [Actinobacillus pleuropneumoniae]KIE91011.1 Lysine exporter protein [Actinobacillus pleuropneumoniae]KIE98223.1 Lysine exporter protein [Actinobacillus pleuropneumoniae]
MAACILLNLTPGSDTIYILTRTIAEGKKAGLMSSFGILTGFLCIF